MIVDTVWLVNSNTHTHTPVPINFYSLDVFIPWMFSKNHSIQKIDIWALYSMNIQTMRYVQMWLLLRKGKLRSTCTNQSQSSWSCRMVRPCWRFSWRTLRPGSSPPHSTATSGRWWTDRGSRHPPSSTCTPTSPHWT